MENQQAASPPLLLPNVPAAFRLKTCLNQFYLLDADWTYPVAEASRGWWSAERQANHEARLLTERLVAEGTNWLTVHSGGDDPHDAVVAITLTLRTGAPAPLDPAAWPLGGEALLALPSGRLEVHNCPAHYAEFAVRLAPDTYRVRVGTPHPDPAPVAGRAGTATCRLDLWPAGLLALRNGRAEGPTAQ